MFGHKLQGLVPKLNQYMSLSPIAIAHLDAIRGLAALAVFVGHWRSFWFPRYPEGASILAKAGYFITGFPHQAVIVFFVLSGYLVGGSILRSAENWQWRPFLIARMTRLWMVLIPALVAGSIFDLVGLSWFPTSPLYTGHSVPIYWSVADRINPETFLGNALFLQTIVVPQFGTNGALWSLANEFWYYALFPLVVLSLGGKAELWTRALYVVIAVGLALFVGWDIIRLFPIWLMGAVVAVAPRFRLSKGASFSLSVLLATLVIGAATGNRVRDDLFPDLALGLICALLIWSVTLIDGRPFAAYQKASHLLSGMSYTLYLVHLPALTFSAAWLSQEMTNQWSTSAVSAAVVFLFACAQWACFERQTPVVRRWVSSRIKAPAITRAAMPPSQS